MLHLAGAASMIACRFDPAGIAPEQTAGDGRVPDAARSIDAPGGEDAALPATAGLVGYWSLDEVNDGMTPDASGNGLHGAVRGAMPTAGRVGNALHFDGVGDEVTIGNPAVLGFTGTISIAAWCKPEGLSGFRNIVVHGFTLDTPGEVYLRTHDDRYEGGSWDGADHGASRVVAAGDENAWVHIASVYDGTTWRLYRNAVEIAQSEDPVGAVEVSADWVIGAASDEDGREFRGAIDEVRIYDRALAPDEIAALVAQGQ